MSIANKNTVDVQGTTVSFVSRGSEDFISLTDIAKYKNPDHADDVIRNRIRNRNTIEFLGKWERLNNPDFNPVEFDGIIFRTGLNSITLTPKQWVEKTRATGIVSRAGRYGGTYAHKDIAFEFASWVSVEFKLYLIKEFQRPKEDENRRLSLTWNLNRTLSKLNYRIHTDAICEHLIPPKITHSQAAITYASEADLLNMALIGLTAKEWRDANPKLDGNMRDHATVEQLLVLANIEGMNAEFIHMNLPPGDRLKRLNQIAIRQMQTLTAAPVRPIPGRIEKRELSEDN
ncbi:MAG: KilA-N domain-containing protein [Deltaproteobacteria bacterium]|nr:KilA-N domain-containing protein [Deltaproteobacteria bacterium]TLN02597.1 MAG: KilA-N domain-containing protein [bacterium]